MRFYLQYRFLVVHIPFVHMANFQSIIVIALIRAFHISVSPMVFHWGLSDRKSPQVSRTFLSILAVLNNAVCWMVSTRLPTSKSSSPFSNLLVTVPNAPITISIIVTCMFHSFFQFPSKQSFHILSILFCGQPGQQSRLFCKFLFFFLLIIIKYGPLVGIR